MKILVTAGSTQMPIDNVRTISNIFKGRTGTAIAWQATQHNDVTLIANRESDQMLCDLREAYGRPKHLDQFKLIEYKTFDELESLMEQEIRNGHYDIVIHSAAVSDYRPVDVLAPLPHDYYNKGMVSIKADKVSSDHPEIYIKCVQTPKLVDYIREPWGFNGVLVKFKLQVGITKEQLLEIARNSRKVSSADFIVANLLDDFNQPSPNMFICGDGLLEEVSRLGLPERLLKIASDSHFNKTNQGLK
jgi:phosphopantothenoylcysteine synthetase/decarboxylase